MYRRQASYRNRPKGYRIWPVPMAVVFLLAMTVAQSSQGAEAEPVLTERRIIGDPRAHFDLRFGQAPQKCTAWRLQALGHPDGYASVDVTHPTDKKVLREIELNSDYFEFVIGDDDVCSYRVRIERRKYLWPQRGSKE